MVDTRFCPIQGMGHFCPSWSIQLTCWLNKFTILRNHGRRNVHTSRWAVRKWTDLCISGYMFLSDTTQGHWTAHGKVLTLESWLIQSTCHLKKKRYNLGLYNRNICWYSKMCCEEVAGSPQCNGGYIFLQMGNPRNGPIKSLLTNPINLFAK